MPFLFDLDGTLADTLADIAAAMNHALAALGLPEHPASDYRAFVGEGADRLAARVLPADRLALKPALLEGFLHRYSEHLLDATLPYPGIPEALDALARRGEALALLSNKPDAATQRIASALFPGRFAVVQGQRQDVPRKPDPTAALAIAAQLGAPAPSCIFVGDSGIDMRTARAAGMKPVGVLWGFRSEEELTLAGAAAVISRPDELLTLS